MVEKEPLLRDETFASETGMSKQIILEAHPWGVSDYSHPGHHSFKKHLQGLWGKPLAHHHLQGSTGDTKVSERWPLPFSAMLPMNRCDLLRIGSLLITVRISRF